MFGKRTTFKYRHLLTLKLPSPVCSFLRWSAYQIIGLLNSVLRNSDLFAGESLFEWELTKLEATCQYTVPEIKGGKAGGDAMPGPGVHPVWRCSPTVELFTKSLSDLNAFRSWYPCFKIILFRKHSRAGSASVLKGRKVKVYFLALIHLFLLKLTLQHLGHPSHLSF